LTIAARVVSRGTEKQRSKGEASRAPLHPRPLAIELKVADTGHGISLETRAKIFEPLYTTKAKGIGLGLAVSKNLVEVNGGTIEVKSTEGQGSTFSLMLPAAPSRLK
jgi:signal transduction histidine kinase